MVEVEVRVDDDVDVLRLKPEKCQRAGNGLVLFLDRLLEGQLVDFDLEIEDGFELEID